VLLRFNPLFSQPQVTDYLVVGSLGGLLLKHDRNGGDAADRLLLGLLGESHRTTETRI